MISLKKLTKQEIENGILPIADILRDSCFYPSSGIGDGTPVKYFSNRYQSFIFCDHSVEEREFVKELNTFRGYHLVGSRTVRMEELIPNGWCQETPPGFDTDTYYQFQDTFKTPFAHWVIFERDDQYTNEHGPERFSLLFVGGEGIATYQALYWPHKMTAKCIAIIQPGYQSFGNNWGDFGASNGPLNWVSKKFDRPDEIIFGGYSDRDYKLDWPGYEKVGENIVDTDFQNFKRTISLWRYRQ